MKAYKTLEELREGSRKRANKHYARHKKEILAKQKVVYDRKKAEKIELEEVKKEINKAKEVKK